MILSGSAQGLGKGIGSRAPISVKKGIEWLSVWDLWFDEGKCSTSNN
jgi:hypothetical protein